MSFLHFMFLNDYIWICLLSPFFMKTSSWNPLTFSSLDKANKQDARVAWRLSVQKVGLACSLSKGVNPSFLPNYWRRMVFVKESINTSRIKCRETGSGWICRDGFCLTVGLFLWKIFKVSSCYYLYISHPLFSLFFLFIPSLFFRCYFIFFHLCANRIL